MHPPKPLRGMFNWYYARIYIKVRPERVFVWPDGDLTEEPDGPRRAPGGGPLRPRRGAAEEHGRARRAARRPGTTGWSFLGEHETGVLSWLGPDGFPIAVRVPLHGRSRRAGRSAIEAEPAGLPVLEGTGLPHRPPARPRLHLAAQHAGPRRPRPLAEGGWRLVPRRIVGGFELPKGVGRFRDFIRKGPGFYRTYRRRLRERELARAQDADLRRERLEPRVPGARLVDVEVVLLHLAMEAVEDAAGRVQRLLQLLLASARAAASGRRAAAR